MTKSEILQERIIELSNSTDWTSSKEEWTLSEIYFQENSKCLCTHSPITECCILINKVNHNKAVVGNCCVKKFWDFNTTTFDAAKRIRQNKAKAANEELIEMAYLNSWITAWEGSFYRDTFRKRKLSPKQKEVRERINEKILKHLNK